VFGRRAHRSPGVQMGAPKTSPRRHTLLGCQLAQQVEPTARVSTEGAEGPRLAGREAGRPCFCQLAQRSERGAAPARGGAATACITVQPRSTVSARTSTCAVPRWWLLAAGVEREVGVARVLGVVLPLGPVGGRESRGVDEDCL